MITTTNLHQPGQVRAALLDVTSLIFLDADGSDLPTSDTSFCRAGEAFLLSLEGLILLIRRMCGTPSIALFPTSEFTRRGAVRSLEGTFLTRGRQIDLPLSPLLPISEVTLRGAARALAGRYWLHDGSMFFCTLLTSEANVRFWIFDAPSFFR